jgi:hypothetical protein
MLIVSPGMWGRPDHLKALEATIRETVESKTVDDVQLEVLVAKTNQTISTYDGVDWGGERVAAEVSRMNFDLTDLYNPIPYR